MESNTICQSPLPIEHSNETRSLQPLPLQFKFSHYTVKEKIGEGAHGKCFIAKDNDGNKSVAIKIASRELGIRETECLIKLNPHRNIVQLLGFQDTEDSSYRIALEVADSDIADMIGHFGVCSRTLNPKQIAHIFKNIIKGYLYIRNNGFLNHTDFSESNTLYFSKQCLFKISDFGYESDFNPERLTSLSDFFFTIASRFSHNCKAIKGGEISATCESNQLKTLDNKTANSLRSSLPDCMYKTMSDCLYNKVNRYTDECNWSSTVSEREYKTTLDLSKQEMSAKELENYVLKLDTPGETEPFEKPVSLASRRVFTT